MTELGIGHLVLFVLLSFAVARLTRLVYKDKIFDAPRNALVDSLIDPAKIRRTGVRRRKTSDVVKRGGISLYVREKIAYLITCPYCVGAYTTAVVLLAYRIWGGPLMLPVLWWFAVWMAAICVLEYTDGAPEAEPKK